MKQEENTRMREIAKRILICHRKGRKMDESNLHTSQLLLMMPRPVLEWNIWSAARKTLPYEELFVRCRKTDICHTTTKTKSLPSLVAYLSRHFSPVFVVFKRMRVFGSPNTVQLLLL